MYYDFEQYIYDIAFLKSLFNILHMHNFHIPHHLNDKLLIPSFQIEHVGKYLQVLHNAFDPAFPLEKKRKKNMFNPHLHENNNY